MKRLIAAVYLGLLSIASPALADVSRAEAARSGDMMKLVFHAAPKPAGQAAFDLADGAGQATLADYQGKVVLVNFWATWCAPCRKEMPHLSELQSELGGEHFEVLTIATGRNQPVVIQRFLDEIGVDNLPRHQDPKQRLGAEMGILGLPITVILDAEGREIARLRGDADWASDSAKDVIRTLLPQS